MEDIKIALVDDNAGLRSKLAVTLDARVDMRVVMQAGNGLEALALIDQTAPDVVVLDIIMPGLDGLGVLRELKKRAFAGRVIMVSALRSDEVVARAGELGAAYFVAKPFDEAMMAERIEDLCRVGSTLPAVPSAALAHAPMPFPVAQNPDESVANLFLSLGIPAHIKGYQYLREAVRMVMNDHELINRITKELYPGVAREFSTSSSKVERAMRHAIEVAWNRGRLEATNRMMGCDIFSARDKPTNGEFIALVADKMAAR